MFSDIFQRFIQKRPVAMMVFILLENFRSCKFSSDKIQINPLGLRQDEGYLYLDHWRPR